MVQQIIDQTSSSASDSTGRPDIHPGVYVPAGKGPAYRSPIDVIRFLITGEQSGGAFFMAENRCGSAFSHELLPVPGERRSAGSGR